MTIGRGHFFSNLRKQKINTRSSMEAELVAVDNALPHLVWTRYFMIAQGYDIKDIILYQDNLSAMLRTTKGKASNGKRIRHLDIRYFLIKDKVDNGKVWIMYNTTTDLTAEYFTKTLQGEAFHQFRDKVIGIKG